MPPPDVKHDSTIVVVESPSGLEIQLRELSFQPLACVQLLLGAVLLVAAATVVAWEMEQHWPRGWTRTGVCIACCSALALAVLVPMLRLFYRWHHVLVLDSRHVLHHCHESWGQHYRRALHLALVRRIHANPHLAFTDPYGEDYWPLRDYSDGEQRQVYRLVVDHLRKTNAIPSLRVIDDWEMRVEVLEKPAESKLLAEEDEDLFRVQIPLPMPLPNERNFRAMRRSACAAGVSAVVFGATMLFFTLAEFPHDHGAVRLLQLVSGVAGFISTMHLVSCYLNQRRVDAQTRQLTQGISVVGDLLIRTTGLGDKEIWRRDEIVDFEVVVTLGTTDSEGNTTSDSVSLQVLTRPGRPYGLHRTVFDRGRNETPRAEIEWIASQLRLALKLYEPAPVTPSPPIESPAPSSTAIIGNRRDVQP